MFFINFNNVYDIVKLHALKLIPDNKIDEELAHKNEIDFSLNFQNPIIIINLSTFPNLDLHKKCKILKL